MRGLAFVSATLLICTVGRATAADICEAIALRDVPALGSNPPLILKTGQRDGAISQYRVDKKSAEDSFCSHGGMCYPVHVLEYGQSVVALRLTNCQIGTRGKDSDNIDPDNIIYSVDVIRSKIPPIELKTDDVDNRLLQLGMCSACAGTAAYLYVNKPNSRCAKLTLQALEGNPESLATLRDMPSYCTCSWTQAGTVCPSN